MRRAERLSQIVQLLRSRNVTTAARLAEDLEVSERTIYRDILDLVSSGVPIDGEAGVGYIMRGGFDLPPLMFTREEIEALVLGARVVESWTDPAMARAARDVLSKIEAVLPERLKAGLAEIALFAPRIGARREGQANPDIATHLHPQAAQGALRLHARRWRAQYADHPAARSVLLGRHVVGRRMVRASRRVPQLPP